MGKILSKMGDAPRHITGKHGDGGVRRTISNSTRKRSEMWIDITLKSKPLTFWQRIRKKLSVAFSRENIKSRGRRVRNFFGDNFHAAHKQFQQRVNSRGR